MYMYIYPHIYTYIHAVMQVCHCQLHFDASSESDALHEIALGLRDAADHCSVCTATPLPNQMLSREAAAIGRVVVLFSTRLFAG